MLKSILVFSAIRVPQVFGEQRLEAENASGTWRPSP